MKTTLILALDVRAVPEFFAGETEAQGRHSGEVAPPSNGAAVAVIPVYGPLRNQSSFFESGMVALRHQITRASEDARIGSIILDIDSPGGTVSGTPETAAVIRDATDRKTVIASVNGMAASAAYWIASSASRIVVSPSSEVGSIGVFAHHIDISEQEARDGWKHTLIHAGKFKVEGNPFEPLTDEAHDQIQSEVDEAYEMFIGDVAKGRGVTVARVRREFGQGRMVSAADAVTRGMADSIAPLEQVIANEARALGKKTPRLVSSFNW